MKEHVEIWTRRDVAVKLKRSVRETYEMQKRGEIPPPDLYLGRSPRWFGERVEGHLRARAGGGR
jgi:hypothetical protein